MKLWAFKELNLAKLLFPHGFLVVQVRPLISDYFLKIFEDLKQIFADTGTPRFGRKFNVVHAWA